MKHFLKSSISFITLVAVFFFFSPSPYAFADTIAFDSFTSSGSSSWSHTVTGTNTLLIVALFDSSSVTAVTYNSVSMTKAATVTVGGTAQKIDVWYLLGASTGTHTVSVTGGSPTSNYSASYTGVSQSGFPDANSSANPAASASVSTSLTTVAANTWSIAFMRNTHANSVTNTGNNITTQRDAGASSIAYFDTGGPTASAGSTVNGNFKTADSANGNWALYIASFAPAATPVVQPSILGLVWSSWW